MERIQDITRIGERGQITIPSEIRKHENLKKGDFLMVTDLGGMITLRKVEAKPNSLDMFRELREELKERGYDTKEKMMKFVDEVKEEVAREWEERE